MTMKSGESNSFDQELHGLLDMLQCKKPDSIKGFRKGKKQERDAL